MDRQDAPVPMTARKALEQAVAERDAERQRPPDSEDYVAAAKAVVAHPDADDRGWEVMEYAVEDVAHGIAWAARPDNRVTACDRLNLIKALVRAAFAGKYAWWDKRHIPHKGKANV